MSRQAIDTALLKAAKRLEARGFFNASACADKATNADMLAMLQAIEDADKFQDQISSQLDAARDLLQEVSRNFTREDDLPDDLLPRIDQFLEAP